MNKLVHPGPAVGQTQQPSKPLVALLDGRDCTVEMPLLKDIATVAFCDAQLTTEIHEKVLNEAVAALLYSIRLSREDLLKFRSLKVIVKIGNPDVHNIDLIAATELGIAVCNMPAEAVEEAADHTISLILNMFRRTFWVARTVQMGKKLQNMDQLRELMASSKRVRGSTLGIIGFGRIGCAVALIRAKALGFRVCFFDPHIVNGMERVIGVERAEKLAELLAQSDCITLHCPLNQETRHLLNNDSLKRLKSGAFLVNIGEADLIDLKALINSLKSGQIKAASFDISQKAMPNEQFADFESLLNMPNVICTPNCAWFSEESLKEMRISAAKEVRRALGGPIPENLHNCVNKSELLALRMSQQRGTSSGQIGGIHQNGFTSNEFGIQQQGMMPSGIGMLLPKSSTMIGQPIQQHHGNEISTSSFATTAGNSAAEYSTIQAPPPPISIEGISSAQADSLQNASALLAYQNFMMQNPQLLMAATRLAGGPIPPMPSNLPTSMAATTALINPAAITTHHPSLNNEFVPANSSPLTTAANLHPSSKSPSSSRPNSGVSNMPITFKQQHQQKPEPRQRVPVEVDEQAIEDNIGQGQGQREMDMDNGRRIENYPSTEQQSSAATTTAADSPETSPHGRLLIADEREDDDDGDEEDLDEADGN